MAKMYYNVEETMAKLGCTEEALRDMVRNGKLREFRDAGKLTYRVDEVDKVAGGPGEGLSLEDSGELVLDDSGEISLTPLGSETGIADVLSSSDTGTSLSGTDIPFDLGGSDTGDLQLGDTGGATDELKLEDSGGGTAELSLDDSGGGSTGADIISLDEVDKDAAGGLKKDDTVITNIGISVFDEEDLEIAADPMAKTLLTGGDEHLGLDGSGGGSGLLDLTRESDDTSLGAELLEGIDMGDTAETIAQTAADEEAHPVEEHETGLPEPGVEPVLPVAAVQAIAMPPDASTPIFTGLLIAATLTLALAGAMSVAISLDTWPGYLAVLSGQFWFFLAGTVVTGGLFALGGWLVGNQKSGSRPRSARQKKAKKGKKGQGAEAGVPPPDALS